MTTIRDIARLADCSVTTVSRVLNRHPYVSEVKRKQILEIIDELDYVPSAQARDLSYGLSKNIGVLIPYANVPYYDKIISGVLNAAFKEGYKITLLPTNYEAEKEKYYLKQLAAKAFDGLIITSKVISFETIQQHLKYGPIVCCEDTGDYPISCVSFNREESYVEVFQHFKESGLRHIGLAVGRHQSISPSTALMLNAHKKVFGHFPEDSLVIPDCRNYEGGVKAGKLFAQLPQLDGIFANSDEVAAGILQTVDLHSIKIIGEENLLAGHLLHFSTVDHHLDRCGEEAFQLLFEPKNTRLSIPYRFIKREKNNS
ncbi:LacI family DNA-binding transcriptional regulator [Enterococcus sp. BWM-S5]|uniref:LacI family DNA-binding transcriptional regulator n=1 Tax=Enterococcus larvae TaxID=2794352 RepID=A0ABS4CMR8_9ENTE|nr:LacI family DNA-binding transcriptional regulator [Enterococcus larvae]MBP1047824.1 LacI family DNA-binding transcriptional regulator [Enterococcus larvae]